MEEAWYVTITRARAELHVAAALDRLDVTSRFYQVRKVIPMGGGHVTHKLLPAFTGYIFTYADAEWYHEIRRINGVIAFLSLDEEGYPSPVDPSEIDRLDRLADKHLVFGTYEPMSRPFKSGDVVRIASGPFEGHHGRFRRYLEHGVITVEINLMGRATPLTLAMHQAEQIEVNTKKSRYRNRTLELLQ